VDVCSVDLYDQPSVFNGGADSLMEQELQGANPTWLPKKDKEIKNIRDKK
jgi:hypothetical protein